MPDDLYQEAFIKLAEIAERLLADDPKLIDRLVEGLILKEIGKRFAEIVEKDKNCSNKYTKPRRWEAQNKGLRFFEPLLNRIGGEDETILIDLWDELEGCCVHEHEITVLRMLAHEFSYFEIALQIGVTEYHAKKMAKAIHKRYLERNRG